MGREKLYLLTICEASLQQGQSWQVTVSIVLTREVSVLIYGVHSFPPHCYWGRPERVWLRTFVVFIVNLYVLFNPQLCQQALRIFAEGWSRHVWEQCFSVVPGICCGAGWMPAAGLPPRRCRCGRSRCTTAPACSAAWGPGPGFQLHQLEEKASSRGIQNHTSVCLSQEWECRSNWGHGPALSNF